MVSAAERDRRKRVKDAYLRAVQSSSAALMPLTREQLEALLARVDEAIQAQGCDHTRRTVDAWARAEGVEVEALHRGLEEYGGFCDCEVVLNVDPEEIFVLVRRPRPHDADPRV